LVKRIEDQLPLAIGRLRYAFVHGEHSRLRMLLIIVHGIPYFKGNAREGSRISSPQRQVVPVSEYGITKALHFRCVHGLIGSCELFHFRSLLENLHYLIAQFVDFERFGNVLLKSGFVAALNVIIAAESA